MTSPMSADRDRATSGDGDGATSADGRRPVGRVRFMDAQRVNLDGFAREEPGLGLVALRSPEDPEPGLVISGGRVTEMDGVPEASFDAIDAYIARHGLDLQVAGEAMGLSDVELARRLVSPDVPRAEIVRLSAGATPAKLARVLALLRPAELGQAMTKLRARRTPSNAVACLVGAAVGAQGVLFQCSVEEALELELGMRGLTSYAETVSLYGTEQ